jgi:predicted Zn-dependent peptidase
MGLGCATAPPPPPPAPVTPQQETAPAAPTREPPPESGTAKPYRFPSVVWAELPNGVRIATIPNKTLPLVQIRVVIGGGRSGDGDKPGLAAITAQLLKDGGAGSMSSKELVTRVESLGGELSIDTSFDATKLGLAVTADRLGEALDLLGAMVQRPQLAGGELEKLKKRESDRLADAARSKGQWGASMMLYRDLFALPTDHHPYASFSATAAEVQRLGPADCRAFHKRFYVPKNTTIIVVGNTTPDVAKAFAAKGFGSPGSAEAPSISFTDPMPAERRKITLVDRPKSTQSDVFVGALGPPRGEQGYAAFAVANQILGGGVSGRLFADVREKRSLAYSTHTVVGEVAHGPTVVMAYAGTQTAKTGLALEGLLENTAAIAERTPDAEEVEVAQRFLAGTFAVHLETIGAVADELARLHVLGLPDDYDDGYRKELGEITPALALKAASEHFRSGHEVIVVAGDATVVGPMLAHFGEVKVVDPTHDFARVRTIPMDSGAPLEAPAAPRQASR